MYFFNIKAPYYRKILMTQESISEAIWIETGKFAPENSPKWKNSPPENPPLGKFAPNRVLQYDSSVADFWSNSRSFEICKDIKGVYVINFSWYVQPIEPVCILVLQCKNTSIELWLWIIYYLFCIINNILTIVCFEWLLVTTRCMI